MNDNVGDESRQSDQPRTVRERAQDALDNAWVSGAELLRSLEFAGLEVVDASVERAEIVRGGIPRPRVDPSDLEFYEDDEPVEELMARFDASEKFVTAPPYTIAHGCDVGLHTMHHPGQGKNGWNRCVDCGRWPYVELPSDPKLLVSDEATRRYQNWIEETRARRRRASGLIGADGSSAAERPAERPADPDDLAVGGRTTRLRQPKDHKSTWCRRFYVNGRDEANSCRTCGAPGDQGCRLQTKETTPRCPDCLQTPTDGVCPALIGQDVDRCGLGLEIRRFVSSYSRDKAFDGTPDEWRKGTLRCTTCGTREDGPCISRSGLTARQCANGEG